MAQDSCVCVYAYQAPRISTDENKGKLVINFHVSTAQISYDPTQPFWKRKPSRHTWTCEKTFNYEHDVFLSLSEAQQRKIMSTMIQDMEIPFPWENVNWAAFLPTDPESKLENVDRAVDRLLGSARLACKQEMGGFLTIRVIKWERVSLTEFRMLEELGREAKLGCGLEDWIRENMNEVNVGSCLKFIYKYHHKSCKENPHFGLKSVIVKEEDKDEPCCAICKQDMKKGKRVIQMPCSHVFHGFCLFPWLEISPTCPLCRFDLLQSK